jgi:hypothetical protein
MIYVDFFGNLFVIFWQFFFKPIKEFVTENHFEKYFSQNALPI